MAKREFIYSNEGRQAKYEKDDVELFEPPRLYATQHEKDHPGRECFLYLFYIAIFAATLFLDSHIGYQGQQLDALARAFETLSIRRPSGDWLTVQTMPDVFDWMAYVAIPHMRRGHLAMYNDIIGAQLDRKEFERPVNPAEAFRKYFFIVQGSARSQAPTVYLEAPPTFNTTGRMPTADANVTQPSRNNTAFLRPRDPGLTAQLGSLYSQGWFSETTASLRFVVFLYNGNTDLFSELEYRFQIWLVMRLWRDYWSFQDAMREYLRGRVIVYVPQVLHLGILVMFLMLLFLLPPTLPSPAVLREANAETLRVLFTAFDVTASTSGVLLAWSGITLLVMAFRALSFLCDCNPAMGLILDTFRKALPNFVPLMIALTAAWLAFGFFAFFMFGSQVYEFSSVAPANANLFAMLLADSSAFPIVFTVLFYVVFLFILLPYFIAIIIFAFTQAAETHTDPDIEGYLTQSFNRLKEDALFCFQKDPEKNDDLERQAKLASEGRRPVVGREDWEGLGRPDEPEGMGEVSEEAYKWRKNHRYDTQDAFKMHEFVKEEEAKYCGLWVSAVLFLLFAPFFFVANVDWSSFTNLADYRTAAFPSEWASEGEVWDGYDAQEDDWRPRTETIEDVQTLDGIYQWIYQNLIARLLNPEYDTSRHDILLTNPMSGVLDIEWATYNGDGRKFVWSGVTFAFEPSGRVRVTAASRPVKTERAREEFWYLQMIVFVLFSIFFVTQIFLVATRRADIDLWLLYDIALGVSMVVLGVAWGEMLGWEFQPLFEEAEMVETNTTALTSVPGPTVPYPFIEGLTRVPHPASPARQRADRVIDALKAMSEDYRFFVTSSAVAIFIVIVRFIKFANLISRLAYLTRTLVMARWKLVSLCAVFIPLFVLFVVVGHLVLGARNVAFRSFSTSFTSCVKMLVRHVASVAFSQYEQAFEIGLFKTAFAVMFMFCVLALVIAILVDATRRLRQMEVDRFKFKLRRMGITDPKSQWQYLAFMDDQEPEFGIMTMLDVSEDQGMEVFHDVPIVVNKKVKNSFKIFCKALQQKMRPRSVDYLLIATRFRFFEDYVRLLNSPKSKHLQETHVLTMGRLVLVQQLVTDVSILRVKRQLIQAETNTLIDQTKDVYGDSQSIMKYAEALEQAYERLRGDVEALQDGVDLMDWREDARSEIASLRNAHLDREVAKRLQKRYDDTYPIARSPRSPPATPSSAPSEVATSDLSPSERADRRAAILRRDMRPLWGYRKKKLRSFPPLEDIPEEPPEQTERARRSKKGKLLKAGKASRRRRAVLVRERHRAGSIGLPQSPRRDSRG
ncbi:unnamed protein product [Vitrella brassicaformis CCMP3155]|uniref:Polycystin cation channel PKD1/PKD2 domain-containing protein n=3 Tax=Vitrella brassicaformis TaxID=1169539 RepID=A0A0G4GWV7_VITBC|nr:unnamed protein product [Vitrella brassicaformis CCMP3155]|eukprot:CEM35448.1 unnamed protein product [Vitrella brassicaformis CCMP3155]